jgi:hypothetical protein
MLSTNITNDKEVLAALERLSTKGMQDTIKRTLLRVGAKLKTEAIKNLRKVTTRSNIKGSKTSKGWEKRPLEKGITNRVWKKLDGATVTIMGDYRLKWFEGGTAERYRKAHFKKTVSTGKMKPSNFFQNAINSKQQSLMEDISKELSKQISKNYVTNK